MIYIDLIWSKHFRASLHSSMIRCKGCTKLHCEEASIGFRSATHLMRSWCVVELIIH